MSSLVIETPRHPVATQPVFTSRFRWMAATVLVLGPLLQLIEFLLENAPDDNAARIALWVADPARVGLSQAAGLLAIPFLLGGVAVLFALTRDYSPRLAVAAAALMTFAMAGLAAVHGVEMAAYGLSLSGEVAAAKTVLDASQLGLPFVVLAVMFFGGAVFGTVTLAAAVWRSPLVPRIVVLCMLAFAVLDFALGRGVIAHLVNLAGFAIVATAVVSGYSRQPGSNGAARWFW